MARRGSRPLALAGAAALSAALAVVAGPAVPATATGCGASSPPGDVNGDGYADVVVGTPGRNDYAGAVRVLYGTPQGLAADATGTAPDDQLITQNTAGIEGGAEPGDEFGAAVTVGQFGGDGCWDVAVGAPGENDDRGTVTVLLGSPAGLTGVGSRLISQNSPGVPDDSEDGDRFGAALAAGDVYGQGKIELLVGAPGEAIGAGKDEGAVWVLAGDGQDFGLTTSAAVLLHQDVPGVPGGAESSDRFGAALVAADPASGFGFAVGAPGENTGAGQVTVFGGGHDPADGLGPVASFSRNGTGVPGAARTRDRFGAALAAPYESGLDGGLVIGVPGRNRNRGEVVVLYGLPGATGRPAPQLFSQGTLGAAAGGPAHDEDEFGAALAVGHLDAGTSPDLAIGAPGDAAGSGGPRAGSVTVLYGTGSAGYATTGVLHLHQAVADIDGDAEPADGFGAALAVLPIHGSGVETLVVGVPAENVGGVLDAGMFHVLVPGDSGPVAAGSQGWTAAATGVRGGPEDAGQLGAALADGLF